MDRGREKVLWEIKLIRLEGLMLKLKLQYFGQLMQWADSLEKTLILGKIEGRRRKGRQKTRWHNWLNRHDFEQTPEDGERQGSLACCSPWYRKELDTTEWLNNNSKTYKNFSFVFKNSHGNTGLPWWLNGKESACQCRRCGFDPWVGKMRWRRKWQPTPLLFMGNPIDRGVWWATVHGVTRVRHDLVNKNNNGKTNIYLPRVIC